MTTAGESIGEAAGDDGSTEKKEIVQQPQKAIGRKG
jgi:hypothetical protein